MKVNRMGLILAMAVAVILVGCQSPDAGSATTSNTAAATPSANGVDANPDIRSLSDADHLALGTLGLEGTENAVTPDQASKLLPLWTLIQGGSLRADAETQAVVKRIRATMTDDQLAAIDGMVLTQGDFRPWSQTQGAEAPVPGDGQAPRGFGNMTDEERAAMRERFQSMTEDERATAMAESAVRLPEGATGGRRPGVGGFRGGNAILTPLIELLTARAAE